MPRMAPARSVWRATPVSAAASAPLPWTSPMMSTTSPSRLHDVVEVAAGEPGRACPPGGSETARLEARHRHDRLRQQAALEDRECELLVEAREARAHGPHGQVRECGGELVGGGLVVDEAEECHGGEAGGRDAHGGRLGLVAVEDDGARRRDLGDHVVVEDAADRVDVGDADQLAGESSRAPVAQPVGAALAARAQRLDPLTEGCEEQLQLGHRGHLVAVGEAQPDHPLGALRVGKVDVALVGRTRGAVVGERSFDAERRSDHPGDRGVVVRVGEVDERVAKPGGPFVVPPPPPHRVSVALSRELRRLEWGQEARLVPTIDTKLTISPG